MLAASYELFTRNTGSSLVAPDLVSCAVFLAGHMTHVHVHKINKWQINKYQPPEYLRCTFLNLTFDIGREKVIENENFPLRFRWKAWQRPGYSRRKMMKEDVEWVTRFIQSFAADSLCSQMALARSFMAETFFTPLYHWPTYPEISHCGCSTLLWHLLLFLLVSLFSNSFGFSQLTTIQFSFSHDMWTCRHVDNTGD